EARHRGGLRPGHAARRHRGAGPGSGGGASGGVTLDLDRIARERGVDLRVWPPRYEPSYRPPPGDPYWLPEAERASREEREELVFAKLRGQIRHAWERSAFYREKWTAAGVSPDDLRNLADFSRFP